MNSCHKYNDLITNIFNITFLKTHRIFIIELIQLEKRIFFFQKIFYIKMNQIKQIQLKKSSILTVPLQSYTKDFTFIVNGKEFQTSRLISELISPVISKIHLIDPTIDHFTINKSEEGDFSNILKLSTFEEIQLQTDQNTFVNEVLEQLGSENIEFEYEDSSNKLNNDNVIKYLQYHSKFEKLYKKEISKEIEFISTHFYEIIDNQSSELKKINISKLYQIINNDQLKLINEDQLIQFVNELYLTDQEFAILYESVLFSNVSQERMKEFAQIFDMNDMTNSIWKNLSERLIQTTTNKEKKPIERYTDQINKKEGKTIEYTENTLYEGIFKHFLTQTNNQIEKEINFTSSSVHANNSIYQPRNVVKFGNQGEAFNSEDKQGSWICFEFKNHHVIPTHYTIRSRNWSSNSVHPKSWVIEGSKDNKEWDTIDKEDNCSFLNGNALVHTFSMNQGCSKEFKYIRMRSTGPDWSSTNYLAFESFEIYGTLI